MKSRNISVPKVSLPKGGGAIRGIGETFQPNPFTGTASLSIPIHTSPCRGFEPQLSLDYSSGSGNGIFGIGFSLDIPSISRKTEKGFPKYDDTDTFLISNADDLVPKLNKDQREPDSRSDGDGQYSVTAFRPRTEGLFARIEQWVRITDGDTHWRVTTKDNVTSIYGESEGARIADPADKTRVFQWLLERTYDAKGNQIVYEYQSEPGNKYIRRIKYGNYYPTTKSESDEWHFEVLFEYSKPPTVEKSPIDKDMSPDRPRPDPFSSYKSGFLIRTSLRCIRISMSHRFEDVAEGNPFEVTATELDYWDSEAASALTLLEAVRHVGYREGADKAMPPLGFKWSAFNLKPAAFQSLELEPGQPVPGFLENGAHQMVDLYGEGLPGVLYTDADAVLYSRPLGEGSYASRAAPHAFPIERNLQEGACALTDLGGDGKLDLVVTTPGRTGYYESTRDGNWEPYRSFASTPAELHHPQRQMVDVTGDGLADLLLFEENAVKVYPSKGKLGYEGPLRHRALAPLPVTSHPSAREAIHFADLFGDGGSHLVRVRNGSVECWPNLGYGRFGPKVEMANAPRFGSEFDASRLFLSDIDGSGTTDLVYAYHD
ncbi:MAG: FG-GAP-like repeat-containing protein, partial [Deltaproteobacteria bacterium]|nr:FG-GAP-like repeat-containing protein [Deltaproteobacteria bacterium]